MVIRGSVGGGFKSFGWFMKDFRVKMRIEEGCL